MAAGFGLLRLSPDTLWALTPRELAAALGASFTTSAPVPTSRAELRDLMRRYPDGPSPAVPHQR
jgi:uncharacterized phage protein (TIGR02216 family)